MANIHGLGSRRDRDNENESDGMMSMPMFGGMGKGMNVELPPFMDGVFSTREGMPDPREETFSGMLKNAFFPNLTWMYFVSVVSMF